MSTEASSLKKNDKYRTDRILYIIQAAVEYFMDPRNFLNETDIFQFYNLSAVHNVGIEEVEAVLTNTFMENASLENGKTVDPTTHLEFFEK